MFVILIIIQIFSVIVESSDKYYTNECQNDWFNYKNIKCIKVWNQSKVNYTEALSECQSLNATLVTIDSEEENLFLTSLLFDLDPEVKGLFIGLKRKVQNDSYLNEFEWTDGTDLKWENWAPGEPTPWFEPCAEIYSVDINAGKWNDMSCSGRRYALCQQLVNPNVSNEYRIGFELCEHLDYVRYRNNCYKAYADYSSVGWSEAEFRCKGDNASLLYIEDSYEHSFIKYWTKSTIKTYEFWIGLIARNNLQNIRYGWVNEWPLYYTAWEAGQPKFELSRTASSQCVIQDWETGLWRSDPYCGDKRAFVCKISDHKMVSNNTYVSAFCPEFHISSKVHKTEEWINLHKNLKHCHWFSGELALNWSDASKHCHKRNGHLVSIHSRHESELLKPFLQRHGRPLWIGLYQSPGGFYRWDDGTDLDFQNWFPGEPTDEHQELCVEMRAQDMTWNDVDCIRPNLQFICEINKILTIESIIENKSQTENKSKSEANQNIWSNGSEGEPGMSGSAKVTLWILGVVMLLAIVVSVVSYFWYQRISEYFRENLNCFPLMSSGFTVNNSGVNSQRSSMNDRNVFDISSIH